MFVKGQNPLLRPDQTRPDPTRPDFVGDSGRRPGSPTKSGRRQVCDYSQNITLLLSFIAQVCDQRHMMLIWPWKRGKLRKVDLFDVKMADGIDEDSVLR